MTPRAPSDTLAAYLGEAAMRHLPLLALLVAAPAAQAQDMVRNGPPQSPIAASVEVPAGSRLVYISGTVPDPVDAADPNAFGDTATQTRSILRKIQSQLRAHHLGLADVVMMRVFLVAPPGAEAMDFAGTRQASQTDRAVRAGLPRRFAARNDGGGARGA